MWSEVDMVIAHISDCILELDHGRNGANEIPELAKSLAELIHARTAMEHLTCRGVN